MSDGSFCFLSSQRSLHPDHVTQQQRAFMCAAEVWAENEERLPSAQVPPAENANTHTLKHTLYLSFVVSLVISIKEPQYSAYMS